MPAAEGIESWLINGAYSWLPNPAGSLRLDVSAANDALAEALAGEIARFSCAAYESLLDARAPLQDSRSLGWPLVRYYYASFYAAHAILRIAGTTVTMISPQTASLLNRVGGQYLGLPPQISSGLHTLQVDQTDPGKVQLTKIGSSNGGSHEEMWKLFLALMLQLEDQIVLTIGGAKDAQATVQVLSELRNQLCRQGKANGAWPSTVRNNVNYRHEYGVWYPYKLKTRLSTELHARMARWSPQDPNGFEIGRSANELACFIDICNVLAQLLTSALTDISRRTTSAKAGFVDRLPFKLLRLNEVAV
ncbi:hypothetical protein [Cupriavidus taiwanensis]|uniref:hypothetical protein n=1 Tax=Cupriavidus taiwanensis TaxID=164546 RepID=UPI0011C01D60|nr:hypothetical protein [Cupriavidus taiwanensis]